ncbi:hypothetical protein BDV06DRAFT_78222 [Aspergillus oleicola]
MSMAHRPPVQTIASAQPPGSALPFSSGPLDLLLVNHPCLLQRKPRPSVAHSVSHTLRVSPRLRHILNSSGKRGNTVLSRRKNFQGRCG